jgi:hypothetical protein
VTGTAPVGVAVLTACAAALIAIVRSWPGPAGAHRRTAVSGETTVEVPLPALMPPWSPRREPVWPEPVHGALAPQAWRACRPCGGETAVVLHPGAHVCDLGHVTVTAAGVGS